MTLICARNVRSQTFYVPATRKLPPFMRRFTQAVYGRGMAVLRRETSRVHLPADFGLGLAVTTVLGGLLLILLAAADGIPSRGPQGESPQPDPSTTYIEPVAPSDPPPLVPTH